MVSQEAYDLCRRLTAKHGKTYYFSTRFFPPKIRRSVYALYGFVRTADEMVDNPPIGSNAIRQLDEFRRETINAFQVGRSNHSVLAAFVETANRCGITSDLALAFLDSMSMDLTTTRYGTFSELTRYTYGSASVIGLMMCRIIGMKSADGLRPAHDLGLAMQLTNFLRDVGEDWQTRGRIYLPLEDLEQYGYHQDELASGKVNDQFRALMRFEIERARCIYGSADEGMKFIPSDCRLPVRLARVLYSKILDKIEANDYDVFRRRAATSSTEKVLVAVRELGRHKIDIQHARSA